MIITLAVIGFLAILALVIYLPFRREINNWFASKKYKDNKAVILAVVIVVIVVVIVIIFLLQNNISSDSGVVGSKEEDEADISDIYTLEIGTQAPPVELPNTEGEIINTQDYNDRVLILSFWNTLCKYCDLQLPIFQRLVDESAGDAEVFLVNMYEPFDVVKTYKEEHDITFPVLVDESGDVGDLFQVRGTPTNFVIYKGMVCANIPGAVELADLVQTLDECKLLSGGIGGNDLPNE